jgi:chromosomal replication initiation ATPase DnaA
MNKFEHHGHFETLFDVQTGRVVGNRPVELEPGREIGESGKRQLEITGDFTINRGQTIMERKHQIAFRAAVLASCLKFNVTRKQLLGRRRFPQLATARHVAIYVMRQLSGASYPILARAFGHKNHRSAMHSCLVVNWRFGDDEAFAEELHGVIRAARKFQRPIRRVT